MGLPILLCVLLLSTWTTTPSTAQLNLMAAVPSIVPYVLELPFRPQVLRTVALVKFRVAAAIAAGVYRKRKDWFKKEVPDQNATMQANATTMPMKLTNGTYGVHLPHMPGTPLGYSERPPLMPEAPVPGGYSGKPPQMPGSPSGYSERPPQIPGTPSGYSERPPQMPRTPGPGGYSANQGPPNMEGSSNQNADQMTKTGYSTESRILLQDLMSKSDSQIREWLVNELLSPNNDDIFEEFAQDRVFKETPNFPVSLTSRNRPYGASQSQVLNRQPIAPFIHPNRNSPYGASQGQFKNTQSILPGIHPSGNSLYSASQSHVMNRPESASTIYPKFNFDIRRTVQELMSKSDTQIREWLTNELHSPHNEDPNILHHFAQDRFFKEIPNFSMSPYKTLRTSKNSPHGTSQSQFMNGPSVQPTMRLSQNSLYGSSQGQVMNRPSIAPSLNVDTRFPLFQQSYPTKRFQDGSAQSRQVYISPATDPSSKIRHFKEHLSQEPHSYNVYPNQGSKNSYAPERSILNPTVRFKSESSLIPGMITRSPYGSHYSGKDFWLPQQRETSDERWKPMLKRRRRKRR